MSDAGGSSIDLQVSSLVALVAALLLVSASASIVVSSPFGDSLDLDDSDVTSLDLSKGRLGSLADANSDGSGAAEDLDGEGSADVEGADEELVQAVEEAVEDAEGSSDGTADGEESGGGGEGSGQTGADPDSVQEDVEDELDREVDEETLETLVERALSEQNDADDDTTSSTDGDGSTEGSTEGSGTGSTGEDSSEGDGEGGSTDTSGSDDGEKSGSVEDEGSLDAADGGLGYLAIALVIVAAAVAAAYGYRRGVLNPASISRLPRYAAEHVVALSFAVAEAVDRAFEGLKSASSPLQAFMALGATVRRALSAISPNQPTTAEDAATVAEEVGQEPLEQPHRLVRDSWSVVTRASGLERPDRKTPGQVSKAAISRGLPRGAVESVTDAFREVEYGEADARERAEDVRRAMLEIKESAGGDRG